MILLVLLLPAILVVVLGVFYVGRRELRTHRSVSGDRPAMLEGGGSHLTVRKGS